MQVQVGQAALVAMAVEELAMPDAILAPVEVAADLVALAAALVALAVLQGLAQVAAAQEKLTMPPTTALEAIPEVEPVEVLQIQAHKPMPRAQVVVAVVAGLRVACTEAVVVVVEAEAICQVAQTLVILEALVTLPHLLAKQ
jgi:hypothetical protein